MNTIIHLDTQHGSELGKNQAALKENEARDRVKVM